MYKIIVLRSQETGVRSQESGDDAPIRSYIIFIRNAINYKQVVINKLTIRDIFKKIGNPSIPCSRVPCSLVSIVNFIFE
jgi:hypothetical protein